MIPPGVVTTTHFYCVGYGLNGGLPRTICHNYLYRCKINIGRCFFSIINIMCIEIKNCCNHNKGFTQQYLLLIKLICFVTILPKEGYYSAK